MVYYNKSRYGRAAYYRPYNMYQTGFRKRWSPMYSKYIGRPSYSKYAYKSRRCPNGYWKIGGACKKVSEADKKHFKAMPSYKKYNNQSKCDTCSMSTSSSETHSKNTGETAIQKASSSTVANMINKELGVNVVNKGDVDKVVS